MAREQKRVIGAVLRDARERSGLSLKDLERMTGFSASQISKVERSMRPDPSFGTVVRIAVALGLSLDEAVQSMVGPQLASATFESQIDTKRLVAFEEARTTARRTVELLDELAKPLLPTRIKRRRSQRTARTSQRD